jgi:hypothetical protein
MESIIKLNDSEIQITKEVPVVEPVKVTYNIDFLKEQEVTILKDLNDYTEKRKTELEEVRNLIAKCEELGLKTKAELQAETVIEEEAKLIN